MTFCNGAGPHELFGLGDCLVAVAPVVEVDRVEDQRNDVGDEQHDKKHCVSAGCALHQCDHDQPEKQRPRDQVR